ncbi:MAG: hypothetical protein LPK80_09350 [Bacteroidota bacterium]|nr:hypothetical protein [Bacteroidota bacterium]MDX5404156.1 hypothetical protein [Bacteroidota bacterium]MDX5426822.1 hypothetical protein [Bacteroidota bacterium]MDX5446815.1 hypothetical protein [Bacteroidota bacterium]MDX5504808.1 hypothetical protein [Bacteroidota bacterium]
MIVIVDSGGTKTEWQALRDGKEAFTVYTEGMNPYYHTDEQLGIVPRSNSLLMEKAPEVDQLFFYGAGCSQEENCDRVKAALHEVFIHAEITVHHDLLGAARAVFDGKPVISCILGTGSNACYFDGRNILQSVPNLGFILGDEGGGAWFGKRLLADHFYGKLPSDLSKQLKDEYVLDLDVVLKKVMRSATPSRYLASFAPFLLENRKHEYVRTLILEGFEEFITKMVIPQKDSNRIPISFIGSIAKYFRKELSFVLERHKLTLGEVFNSPIDGLIRYHLEESPSQ